jgi:hypothetical protein
MNWKPPRITDRTASYTKQFDNMTDAEKLEHFNNIVGAAFRKGYNMRKGDERKMRPGHNKLDEQRATEK